jgi:hypothetical protein
MGEVCVAVYCNMSFGAETAAESPPRDARDSHSFMAMLLNLVVAFPVRDTKIEPDHVL